jgi:AraC-like DNA-binding protein
MNMSMVRSEQEQVLRASGLDELRDLVRETFALELRTWGDPDERHWARFSVSSLGAVQATAVSAGPAAAEVRRTPKLIRQVESDAYKLELLRSGDLALTQDGRQAILRPGDFALCDLSRPVSMRSSGDSRLRLVALTVPRTLLPLPPEQVARLTAVSISGQRGTGALVSSLLGQLAHHLDDCSPAEAARISTAVLDLLVGALARRLELESSVPPGSHREALLQRIYAFMEERLGDPQLSPTMIAAACHVSVRYLHKLFQEQGATVAGWIRRRRLERCRRDLADPGLATHTVGTVAARWGFASSAHFSHAFRAAYGLPPTEYRHRAYLRRAPAPSGPRPHQPGLVGKHHRLHPVAQGELAE